MTSPSWSRRFVVETRALKVWLPVAAASISAAYWIFGPSEPQAHITATNAPSETQPPQHDSSFSTPRSASQSYSAPTPRAVPQAIQPQDMSGFDLELESGVRLAEHFDRLMAQARQGDFRVAEKLLGRLTRCSPEGQARIQQHVHSATFEGDLLLHTAVDQTTRHLCPGITNIHLGHMNELQEVLKRSPAGMLAEAIDVLDKTVAASEGGPAGANDLHRDPRQIDGAVKVVAVAASSGNERAMESMVQLMINAQVDRHSSLHRRALMAALTHDLQQADAAVKDSFYLSGDDGRDRTQEVEQASALVKARREYVDRRREASAR